MARRLVWVADARHYHLDQPRTDNASGVPEGSANAEKIRGAKMPERGTIENECLISYGIRKRERVRLTRLVYDMVVKTEQ